MLQGLLDSKANVIFSENLKLFCLGMSQRKYLECQNMYNPDLIQYIVPRLHQIYILLFTQVK